MDGRSRWELLQEVFDAASRLPSESREEWLSRACAGDRTLYLQAHSLLLALDEENGAIEKEIGSYAARLSDHPPERIGPYRVLSQIGHGGMGEVYLAERDDQQYERRVAIKIIRSTAGSRIELLRRFRVERQILAGLQHPNIAQMLDGGVMEDGAPYLVMEFVEGVRIDQYCDRHQISLRQRIELFRQVCSAVQHAHRNLVVHRDIKPSNILVTGEGVPKLLDFGIAKLLRSDDVGEPIPEMTALTAPAHRLMTPEYASPEQVRGLPIVTTTDVYGLGIVLYELAAGRNPFADSRRDFLTLERAICETEPRAPSSSGSPFAPQLRGDLDAIVLKAIRKEPGDRYASADQLSDDLGRYLDGFPVAARHGSRRYRAGKFIHRHRFGVAAAAAFVLLLAGFGVAMAVLATHIDRERTRSEAIADFLGSLFSSSDPYHDAGQNLTAKDLLARGSARVATELAAQPDESAELLQIMAEAYEHLGDTTDAEALFHQELEADIRAYGPQGRKVAGTMRQIGDLRRQHGDLEGAEDYFKKSLAIVDKLPPDAAEERSHVLNNLALVRQIRGNLAEAEGNLVLAVSLAEKFPKPEETLTMRGNLASVILDRGRPEEAEKLWRSVLAGRRRLLGERHTQVAYAISSLAQTVAAQGRYSEAEQLQRDALERRRALLGEDNTETRGSLLRLGDVLVQEGALGEAEAVYRQGFVHGSTDVSAFERARWYSALGSVLFHEGRAAEAEPLLQKALEAVAMGGHGSLREARYLVQYGELETSRRNFPAARKSLQDALEIYRTKDGIAPAELNDVRFRMAQIDGAEGRAPEADAAYRQVLDADRAASPARPLLTATHLLADAAFLAVQPDSADAARAEPLAREALDIRTRMLPADFWSIAYARGVLAGALARNGREPEARTMAAAACQALTGKLGSAAPETQEICHPSRSGRSSRE